MSQPGAILYYQDFTFEDGTKRDKFFVVLNPVDVAVSCLVLKTTSQSKRYEGVAKGCNQEKHVFFVPVGWQKCFESNTYIQLPQIFEIPTVELLQGALSKQIRLLTPLSDDCLKELKSCLKKFKNDISSQHWKLIFES